MKNLSLYLNIILALAIGLLYFFHFSEDSKSSSNHIKEGISRTFTEGEIVYVDFDTLLLNYNYYTDLKNELMDKKEKLEAELNSKSKKFESEAKNFQEKVQKGLITRSNAQKLGQELAQKEESLYQLRDNLTRELLEEEQVMNRKLQYDILEFLNGYCENKDFNYILSNTFGGAFLYTDKRLNITKDVIIAINEKYKNSKE